MKRMHSGAGRRLLAAMLTTAFAVLLVGGSALAHEHRHVGDYELTVGFLVEPAIVEQPNGLDLRVATGEGDDAEPVEGLENTLQAEIIHGDQRLPLTIRARWGQPGAYTSDVIPTATGTYTFRIYGTINGTAIDESFVGGPNTFSEVAGRDTMNFPNQIGTLGEVQASADDASDSAGTAMTMAIIALLLGLLGLALGALAFIRSAATGRGAAAKPAGQDETS